MAKRTIIHPPQVPDQLSDDRKRFDYLFTSVQSYFMNPKVNETTKDEIKKIIEKISLSPSLNQEERTKYRKSIKSELSGQLLDGVIEAFVTYLFDLYDQQGQSAPEVKTEDILIRLKTVFAEIESHSDFSLYKKLARKYDDKNDTKESIWEKFKATLLEHIKTGTFTTETMEATFTEAKAALTQAQINKNRKKTNKTHTPKKSYSLIKEKLDQFIADLPTYELRQVSTTQSNTNESVRQALIPSETKSKPLPVEAKPSEKQLLECLVLNPEEIKEKLGQEDFLNELLSFTEQLRPHIEKGEKEKNEIQQNIEVLWNARNEDLEGYISIVLEESNIPDSQNTEIEDCDSPEESIEPSSVEEEIDNQEPTLEEEKSDSEKLLTALQNLFAGIIRSKQLDIIRKIYNKHAGEDKNRIVFVDTVFGIQTGKEVSAFLLSEEALSEAQQKNLLDYIENNSDAFPSVVTK